MASTQRRLPIITVASVEAALDSLLYTTSDTSAATSLHYLAIVDHFLESPERPPAEALRQYALRCILHDVITAELTRQRQIFGLLVPQADSALANAQQELLGDSQQNSPELMAWSLLYYRYVRVELTLTQEEISTLTAIHPRTLLRYKKHAIERLTDLLITAEWDIRAQQRQRRLLAHLPKYGSMPLIGRETEVRQIHHILTTQTNPCIFITGQTGVGKSALLYSIVIELIKINHIDEVIWLENPVSVAALQRELDYRLVPARSRTTTVRDMLLTWRVVIILDGITPLVNSAPAADWQQMFALLSFATTLVTSEIFRPIRPDVVHLPLSNLSWEATQVFLRYLFKQQDRDETALQDYAAAIWHITGGNPQGTHLAFAQIEQGNLDFYEQVVLDELFTGIYDALDVDTRQMWHILSILPEGQVSVDTIYELALAHTLPALLAAHLVQPVDTITKHYCMNHPARQFIALCYHQREETRHLFQQLIVQYFHAPTWFFELLLATDWLTIDHERALHWLRQHGRSAIKTGQPVRWRYILEKYRAVLDLPLRFGYAVCLRRTGDWAAAQRVLRDCVAESGKKGDFWLQAEMLIEIAVLNRQRGEYQKAQHWLQKAALQSPTHPELPQRIALEWAQIAIDSGDVRLAQQHLHVMPENETTCLLYAELSLLNRQFDECQRLAQKILANASETALNQAAAHTILGRSYQAKAQFAVAVEHFDAARIVFERSGDVFAAARAQSNLAAALLALHKWDDAEKLLSQAHSLQSQLHDVVGYNATQINLNVLTRQRLLASTHEETAE
jgi:tetratricopeptide (TPR) repeat protein